MNKQDIGYKKLYYLGIALAVILAGACLLIKKYEFVIYLSYGQCLFFNMFGTYCPGCGGTRALNAFLHGDILSSFTYHPVIVYCFGIYLVFMVTYSLHLLSKGRMKYLRVNYITIASILALILVQWAIKVFLQVEFGYQLF